MGAKILVIGIDAATWSIIEPSLDQLPNFKKLKEEGNAKTLTLDQKPWSASCWTSMFTGKTEEDHGHKDFVVDGEVQERKDVKADFIWDILDREGKKVKALNIPFIVPPYNFNTDFVTPGSGIPTTYEEMDAEIEEVTKKSLGILENNNLDLFIVCYVSLDKLQHLHWGEPVILDYYKKVDAALGQLIGHGEKLIVVSDHGFCDFDNAPVRTLPEVAKDGTKLKGDHHPNAILITENLDCEIKTVRDIFGCLVEQLK